MNDQIELHGIRATGYHGVFASERENGQEFIVDVTLHVDTRPAASTDDLERTINYGEVANRIAAVIAGEPVDLIETLAERIAAVVMEMQVARVDVTVHKPSAPIEVSFTDVTVKIQRSTENPPVVDSPCFTRVQAGRLAKLAADGESPVAPSSAAMGAAALAARTVGAIGAAALAAGVGGGSAVAAASTGAGAAAASLIAANENGLGGTDLDEEPEREEASEMDGLSDLEDLPVSEGVPAGEGAPVGEDLTAGEGDAMGEDLTGAEQASLAGGCDNTAVFAPGVIMASGREEPPTALMAAQGGVGATIAMGSGWGDALTPGTGAGTGGLDPRADILPASPVRAVIALGANLGEAAATLRQAVRDLGIVPHTRVAAVSPLARTAPVGGPAQPDYLNAVVIVETQLSPRQLLTELHKIENAAGRERTERWGARTLDLDIVTYGNREISDAELIVPHPRAHERAFVLQPWLHLEPNATLPGRGAIATLAKGATDGDGIRWLMLDWHKTS